MNTFVPDASCSVLENVVRALRHYVEDLSHATLAHLAARVSRSIHVGEHLQTRWASLDANARGEILREIVVTVIDHRSLPHVLH